MDLIGSINYIENRLDRRKPNQGRDKAAQKKIRSHAEEEKAASPDSEHSAAEPGGRLGQKIDTTV